MRKPIYQKLLLVIYWLLLGAIALGGLLDALDNAISLINLQAALWITSLIIVVYLFLLVLFQKRQIKWISKDGQSVTILNLGKRLMWAVAGAILLLWLPIIFGLSKPKSSVDTSTTPSNSKPVFDSLDSRFKILVLPFDKECDYQGLRYDIGKVICKRLETLNNVDKLGIVTYYLSEFLESENFTVEKADSLLKYHHADQIVYGFYSLRQCEGGSSDKICFNYRTDAIKWNLTKKQSKVDYDMIMISGLDALRNGAGQEDIDYVIYWIAGTSALGQDNFGRALEIFQKIKNFDKDEKILNTMGVVYMNNLNYRKAINLLKKAVEINQNDKNIWANLGYAYFAANYTVEAKTCYEEALKISSNNEQILYNLGTIYESEGNFAKAKIYYLKALSLNPSNADAWNNLGNTYINLGEIKSAKTAFDKTLKIEPDNEKIWYNLAKLYSLEYNKIEALKSLAKSILLDISSKSEAKSDKVFQWLWNDKGFLDITQQNICDKFRNGTFAFYSEYSKKTYSIYRLDSIQFETEKETGNITEWKVSWISDCEYNSLLVGDNYGLLKSEQLKNIPNVNNVIISTSNNYYIFKAKSNLSQSFVIDTIWKTN